MIQKPSKKSLEELSPGGPAVTIPQLQFCPKSLRSGYKKTLEKSS